MAIVKVNTKNATRAIRKMFSTVMSDLSLSVEIVTFSLERIKAFARLSKRMESKGSTKSLPTLSKSYQEERHKILPGEKGTDPNFFLPANTKSNLTFTGQLLEGLNPVVLESGPDKNRVMIEVSGTRRDGQTNQEIYEKLKNRNPDYAILQLDKKAINQIRSIVLKRLRKEVQRLKVR